MLTNQKMLIGTVLEAMQKIDNNGEWMELYQDLCNGEISIKEAYNYILETLTNWLDDAQNDEYIQFLIKQTKDIYNA